ncbi:lipid II flippase MurJ [Desulfovibrio sp. ZJ369]|uniref:lipid II flippase MurJ n=1 Tax=Desulfovibrio sp. ZJ369 TaxID=2709793 RepID=UPI0013ECE64C|nr:lipid II flippase MurJ [Desulfovibrio sp. ZJ369]
MPDHEDKHGALSPGRERVLRAAALIGGFTLLSRLLGLARDMSMAWLLGGGAAADALVAAMRLPHVLRRLLGEGSLSMTLTAGLVRHSRHKNCSAGRDLEASPVAAGDQERRQRQALAGLAAALAPRLAGALALLTVIGLVAAPWLMAVLAPGFSVPEAARAVDLLRICLPYLLAAGMAALGMALLHSMEVFWLPALSPALFNLTMLLFAAAAALGIWPPATTLALGMLCGGMAQWLAQWLALQRLLPGSAGPGPDDRAGAPDAEPQSLPAAPHPATKAAAPDCGRMAWRCLARLPAGLLGAAAPQLAMLAAMSLASGLGRGQVAALYYAERLLELPLGLVGVCLGMASLPALSRSAEEKNFADFAGHLGLALRYTLLFSLPAAAGLWAVGPALVDALLRHGAFNAQAARETGLALWAYLPGLPAFALNRSLLSACNALGRIHRTAASAAWAVAATLAAGAALIHSLPAAWLTLAPALAVSIGLWLQSGLLWRDVRQSLRRSGQNSPLLPARIVTQQAAAAAAAGLAAWAVLQAMEGLGVWPGLATAIAAGLAAWASCLALLGNADLAILAGRLRAARFAGRSDRIAAAASLCGRRRQRSHRPSVCGKGEHSHD